MPIYEFACQSCGKDFEELVFNAKALEKLACPACESKEIEKKISMFASSVKSNASFSPAPACGST
jgi:putative FmdB family regulatory protein